MARLKRFFLISDKFKLSVLFLAATIIFLRAPSLFFEPRFWAEEGLRYFRYAFNFPWYDSLFNVQQGYFSLVTNIATLLSVNIVQLEHAPLVTTIVAFFIQLIPVSIILWSRSDIWNNKIKKLIGVWIIIVTPLSEEIWLNTINSQFYLSLVTFIILIENTEIIAKSKKWIYRILLICSGLTGVVACFLTPLFISKIWFEKTRESVIQAIILITCLGVQVTVLWTTIDNQPGVLNYRLGGINLAIYAAIVWTKTIALLFLGLDNAVAFTNVLHKIRTLGEEAFKVCGIILFFMELFFVKYIMQNFSFKKIVLIGGSYLMITIPSIILSLDSDKFSLLHPEAGQRYFFVPNIIFMILLFSSLSLDSGTLKPSDTMIRLLLLSVSLILGTASYIQKPVVYDQAPIWREEVLKWQEDASYELKIWPPGWQMKLVE